MFMPVHSLDGSTAANASLVAVTERIYPRVAAKIQFR
jgi:hypothetical protein